MQNCLSFSCFVIQRAHKEPKTLEYIFGINVHSRDSDGLLVYNNNRLIVIFEHTSLQKNYESKHRGIVGVVNIPYNVLEPTHNKQSFVEPQERKALIKSLTEHMDQYLNDLGKDLDTEFWEGYG